MSYRKEFMRFLVIILLTFFSSYSFSLTQTLTLDNGLKVLITENHRSPIVVSLLCYDVGSADEPPGITGVSHALEHLLFKGTPHNPIGVFSHKLSALGGEFNALTSNDYTCFYEKAAAQHLPLILELEADRMQNLTWDAKEFSKEIKVIQEERRLRTDNEPHALAFERFLATAHLSSPYHHPVIGWMSDLKQIQMNDAKSWYEHYYAPNNATLVIIGDISTNQVRHLAEQHFGKLTARPQVQRKNYTEPRPLGKKTVQIQSPANLPTLILGYSVPTVKTVSNQNNHEPYTLEVISALLGAPDSGRLCQRLEHQKQIAGSTGVHYNLYARYQTQFSIYGIPSRSRTLNDLAAALSEEIKYLQTELVKPDELARIKTQLIAQKVFEKDSIFTQAMEMGVLETIGLGWKAADNYALQINQITPEQIRDVAKHYFREENSTEARLTPLVDTFLATSR